MMIYILIKIHPYFLECWLLLIALPITEAGFFSHLQRDFNDDEIAEAQNSGANSWLHAANMIHWAGLIKLKMARRALTSNKR